MTAPNLLERIEVEAPGGTARGSVIWLHGLGADGHDFEPIVPELGLADLDLRFVFPHAPAIPITINGGMVMPGWYDILAMELERKVDEAGVLASAAEVNRLIEHEKSRGIPAERILLAGFSQGGAIALHAALRYPERLAGCMALSTYLVRGDALESERSAANEGLACFHAHGTHDPMVPLQAGDAARQKIEQLGYDVTWRTYPMLHQVCPEELADIATWLRARFA